MAIFTGEKVAAIRWEGEVPWQKWTTFYNKILSGLASGDLKVTVQFESRPAEGLLKERVETVKVARPRQRAVMRMGAVRSSFAAFRRASLFRRRTATACRGLRALLAGTNVPELARRGRVPPHRRTLRRAADTAPQSWF